MKRHNISGLLLVVLGLAGTSIGAAERWWSVQGDVTNECVVAVPLAPILYEQGPHAEEGALRAGLPCAGWRGELRSIRRPPPPAARRRGCQGGGVWTRGRNIHCLHIRRLSSSGHWTSPQCEGAQLLAPGEGGMSAGPISTKLFVATLTVYAIRWLLRSTPQGSSMCSRGRP